MKWFLAVFVVLLVATLASGARASPPSSKIRVLLVGKDEVVRVRTAIGYSTILKFDSKPRPVLSGDQDGFKIEPSKKIVSIKPIIAGAKTNLFVFTDYDRYVFDIVSARGGSADYEIEVRRRPEPSRPLSVAVKGASLARPLGLRARCGHMAVSLDAAEWSAGGEALSLRGAVQIEGAAWKSRSAVQIAPEEFFVFQGRKSLSIESLYLETPTLNQKVPRTAIVLVLKREHLMEVKNLTLELKTEAPSRSCQFIRINLPWSKIRPLRS